MLWFGGSEYEGLCGGYRLKDGDMRDADGEAIMCGTLTHMMLTLTTLTCMMLTLTLTSKWVVLRTPTLIST